MNLKRIYKAIRQKILLGLRLRFNEELISGMKKAVMLNELVYRMDIMEFEKIQIDQEAIQENYMALSLI